MELTIRSDDGDVVRMQLKGQVIQSTLEPPEPVAHLLGSRAYSKKVTLDMSETSFVDSSGIGWILGCHKKFRQASGTLVIHSVPPVVLDMMKVMRLDQVLKIAEDEPAALALVRGAKS